MRFAIEEKKQMKETAYMWLASTLKLVCVNDGFPIQNSTTPFLPPTGMMSAIKTILYRVNFKTPKTS